MLRPKKCNIWRIRMKNRWNFCWKVQKDILFQKFLVSSFKYFFPWYDFPNFYYSKFFQLLNLFKNFVPHVLFIYTFDLHLIPFYRVSFAKILLKKHLKVCYDFLKHVKKLSKFEHEEEKTYSCLIKSSIGCFWALNYLLIGAVYVFDSN